MAFLCVPDSGSPVTVESEGRALTLAARGWVVSDLDAVEAEPAKKPTHRKPKAPAPE